MAHRARIWVLVAALLGPLLPAAGFAQEGASGQTADDVDAQDAQNATGSTGAAEAEASDSTREPAKVPSPDVFIPTEEISEDASVPFPIDI